MSLSVWCRAPITEQRLWRFLRRALGGCGARPSKASSLAPRRAGACHGRVSATRRRARARVSVCVSVRVCASVSARASASASLRDAGAAVFARGLGWGAGERGGGERRDRAWARRSSPLALSRRLARARARFYAQPCSRSLGLGEVKGAASFLFLRRAGDACSCSSRPQYVSEAYRGTQHTPCGTRTRNLRIRGPTPCPLGQGGW